MVDTTRPAPTAAGSEVFGAAGIPLAVAAVAGKKWTTGATDAFVNKTERTNLRHTHIYVYETGASDSGRSWLRGRCRIQ